MENIEILDEGPGYPAAVLSNSFREHFEKSDFSRIEISLSHTGEYAAATALVWG